LVSVLLENLSLHEWEVLILLLVGLGLLHLRIGLVEGLFLVVVGDKLIFKENLIIFLLFFLVHDLLVNFLKVVVFSFQLNLPLRGLVGHVVPDLLQVVF
jgi:hypothetical protein